MRLFHFQAENNPLYKEWIRNLAVEPSKITSLRDIPFLPITFFKSRSVKTLSWASVAEFTSSGTTGTSVSRHPIFDLQFYMQHAEHCFSSFFGDPGQYHFFALLPSYLERKDSSLVAMIDHFIKRSGSSYSGFYLQDMEKLLEDIDNARADRRRTILWGVSFALLDLALKYQPDLSDCLIFETGGMKGRRSEITRKELHSILMRNFNVSRIYAEYGMTELLSQAYTKGGEMFYCPPSMKVLTREITDPANKGLISETGGINVIDLANWHSIGFVETEDLGKVYPDGSFEVLGRMDNTDLRGCNLMVE